MDTANPTVPKKKLGRSPDLLFLTPSHEKSQWQKLVRKVNSLQLRIQQWIRTIFPFHLRYKEPN